MLVLTILWQCTDESTIGFDALPLMYYILWSFGNHLKNAEDSRRSSCFSFKKQRQSRNIEVRIGVLGYVIRLLPPTSLSVGHNTLLALSQMAFGMVLLLASSPVWSLDFDVFCEPDLPHS